MKKYFRAIQTMFPYLQDARFTITSYLVKITGNPQEKDFLLLSKFKPAQDQVLVDIGANRGLTIVSISLFRHMKNKIIGFEPNLLVFDKLKNNRFIRKNDRVTLFLCGLSNNNGKLPLFVPFYRKWMFDGLASFDYHLAKDWLTHRLWNYDRHKLSIKRISCEVKKLDDFEFNPYFIKIDVQGYELQVLQGAENTIRMYRPILLIECINEQIVLFLEQFNYLYFYYDKGILKKGWGKLNTFCMTEGKYIELTTEDSCKGETARLS